MRTINTLLFIAIIIMTVECEKPEVCYSEHEMQMERQLRYDTIEYFENLITYKDSTNEIH